MIRFLITGVISGLMISGSFAQVSQERNVDPFKAIENRSSVDLYIYQGSSPRVVIETDESVMDKVETWVQDGILVIDLDRCPMNVKTLKAHITVTDLERLHFNGSGDCRTETLLEVPQLEVRVNGSGDTRLKLNTDALDLRINGSGDSEVEGTVINAHIGVNGSGDVFLHGGNMKECTVKLTGSGDVELSGTTDILTIKQVSSGDVDADDLKATVCTIDKSGSGDTSVWIDGDLSVTSSGSGDVYYRGMTQVKSISVTGSGDVRKIR
ncbi:MAG: DUF2807 domain-containing protein [Bacteroidales bacterium]|nr:DUF2807 domain-containing protein [Lentimicrobiaceae bacterium]MDD5694368.1 DUF2807 domain-containing protein [Bacteroidales bacterium]